MENVPANTEDQDNGKRSDEPWPHAGQIVAKVEIEQTEGHHRQSAGGQGGGPQAPLLEDEEHHPSETEADQRGKKADPRVRDDGYRRNTERDRDHETSALADEIALFLLEAAQLTRIVQRVADVAQRLQQFGRIGARRIVFNQRLLVRQAHRHLVDARLAPKCFLDGADAERAVQAADAGADARPVRAACRFLGP